MILPYTPESFADLDDDALIQAEAALNECCKYLKGEPSMFPVTFEATMAHQDAHREIVRRACKGKTLPLKRTTA